MGEEPAPDLSGVTDFAALFGRAPAVFSDAPGRVNLIGEHTDYNGGLVLPTAIPQRTRVAIAPRGDGTVRAWSANLPGQAPEEYALGREAAGRGWLDYVQGVTFVLRRAGLPLQGFDVRLESDVPLGAGLSSSAALEIALLRGLRTALSLPLDDREMALLGQAAENDFVGARVGIMDQMASSLADESVALLLDARSLETERIPIPPAVEVGVIASGIRHDNARGGYGARRAECEEAARRLQVPLLRDVQERGPTSWESLPPPLDRRVRHVVTENDRVRRAVDALRSSALEELGELLSASHRSLRDDFDVSLPELDLLVEIAGREPAIRGARLTGGGFGGSVVLVGERGETRTAARRITRGYREKTGRAAEVLLPLA